MKIFLLPVIICAALLSACGTTPQPSASFRAEHTARASLDWAGTYRGVLPCADCEGIDTVVTLADDGTYQTRSQYIGRAGADAQQRGTFSWNADGNTVTLSPSGMRYFVTENRLIQRAMDGSTITGPLADKYVLTKE